MAIFITGASGYIGGSVAARLIGTGREVRGLVRSDEKAKRLAEIGVTPVLGSLDDAEVLIREARASDGVVKAADSRHRSSLEAVASFAQISVSASQFPLPRVLGLHFRPEPFSCPPPPASQPS